MTATVTIPPTPGHDGKSGSSAGSAGTVRLTPGGVARSEWVKFRTLRSSWWVLFASVLSLITFAVVLGYTTGHGWSGLDKEDSSPSAVLQGYHLVTLLIGVLGVLFVTGEYGTGMIRSTLGAVPRRLPVLAAKALVLGVIATVTMLVSSVVAWLGGQAVLSHYGHGTSLTAPGVLRVVLGTGVFLALVCLLGMAIGWIVRNTAGGISATLGLLLVLPLLTGFLPSALNNHITPYLPNSAGEAFISSVKPDADSLSPWVGLAVLLGWVLAAFAVAAMQLRRRDA